MTAVDRAGLQTLEAVARSYCSARGLACQGLAGSGAFKATFRATTPTSVPVAVKVFANTNVSSREQRELEALHTLSGAGHPSLPSFLAVELFGAQQSEWLVTVEEFLEGGSLAERLRQTGHLPRVELRSLAVSLCAALEVVARERLVHRDIKPENIMFRGDGTPVLVDFGLVRKLQDVSLTQSWLPNGPGTPFYAAPEQLNNEKALIAPRTDQFSLGVTLAVAATGRHPYSRPEDRMEDVVARVAARTQPSDAFRDWVQQTDITPLSRMVLAWPVERFPTHTATLMAWKALP